MKPRTLFIKLLLLVFSLSGLEVCQANPGHCGKLSVIVNPSNPITEISFSDLVAIYKGKKTLFEGNGAIMPIDYGDNSPCKKKFYRLFLHRDIEKMKRYWVRMIFSGNGSPPAMMKNSSQVLDFIANNTGGIGYLPREMLGDRVKEIDVK